MLVVVEAGGGILCSVVCYERKVFDFFPASSITTAENTKTAKTFDNTPPHGLKRRDDETEAETWRCTGSSSVHTEVRGIDKAE